MSQQRLRDPVQIDLQPVGEKIVTERGTPLREILPPYGVEFPCGGRGLCDGCRVKVLSGALPVSEEQEEILSKAELSQGWRLMCRCRVFEDVTLDVAQWDPVILGDHSEFDFTPGPGLGIAVDLGTTTLVAQLLDLERGRVLAVRSALNPQVGYGSDVMSRLQHGLDPAGADQLAELIRDAIGDLIGRLFDLEESNLDRLGRIVIVGNTVMHHLFAKLSVHPLSAVPFQSPTEGLQEFSAGSLGWNIRPEIKVEFLPCLGGFVGSDLLAGLLSTQMHQSTSLLGLIDLGTNGEIAFGNRDRIVCASTAAGPAFEGGRISMGMRATPGAIAQVTPADRAFHCQVIANVPARGICGSGLVDAAASALSMGWLEPNGRISAGRKTLDLTTNVRITQRDIRELQLAKAAIAAGVKITLEHLDCRLQDVEQLFLAGAFGNYIGRASAHQIGLFPFPLDRVRPLGNTALRGAKLALFEADYPDRHFQEIRKRVEHLSLATNSRFQECFAEAMAFPPSLARTGSTME